MEGRGNTVTREIGLGKETFILLNGKAVPFADAKIHVLAPAITYAATVFEGIRAYWDADRKTMWMFRLDDHLKRLQASMKIMRYGASFERAQMAEQIRQTIRINELREDIHIRVLAMVEGAASITTSGTVSYAITAGPYPPNRWVDKGLAIGVSSWHRVHDTASPPRVKATSNYSNGRLAMMEAQTDGYDAALMLTREGKVSEAPVAAFFMVKDGVAHTPLTTDGILESITRDTLIRLFRDDLGVPVTERQIDRSELYTADEMFLCGSGWEIAPIASVDRIAVGDGEIGPVTKSVRSRYRELVTGRLDKYSHWLDAV
jgi:branched-chain amino acid aminotransferase